MKPRCNNFMNINGAAGNYFLKDRFQIKIDYLLNCHYFLFYKNNIFPSVKVFYYPYIFPEFLSFYPQY